MIANLIASAMLIGIMLFLFFLAAVAFIPKKKIRKKALRLCAYHSAENTRRGVWILDSRNCDYCKQEPKGAA